MEAQDPTIEVPVLKEPTAESIEETKDDFIVTMVALTALLDALRHNPHTTPHWGDISEHFNVPEGFALLVTPIYDESVMTEQRYYTRERDDSIGHRRIDGNNPLKIVQIDFVIPFEGTPRLILSTLRDGHNYEEINYGAENLLLILNASIVPFVA